MKFKSHVRLFGVPVRFDPTFVVLVAGFGFLLFLTGDDPQGTAMFAAWIPLVTLAVLAHELGHALVGRLFGLTPFVVLHGMGGLTTFPSAAHRALPHGRRILITLAGPLAGIGAGSLALAAQQLGGIADSSVPGRALMVFFWVTAGWGLLNLVPVLPLDGGHVVATALERFFGRRGVQATRIASIAVALSGAAASGVVGYWVGAGLLGLLAFGNYRAYRREAELPKIAVGPALDAGYAALVAGEPLAAAKIVEHVRDAVATDEDRVRHAHLAAWSALLLEHPDRAHEELQLLPPGTAPDALLDGRVRLATGDAPGAITPLLEALLDRGDDEIAELLGDAMHAASDIRALSSVLQDPERAEVLGEHLARQVSARVSAPELATSLEASIRERYGLPDAERA